MRILTKKADFHFKAICFLGNFQNNVDLFYLQLSHLFRLFKTTLYTTLSLIETNLIILIMQKMVDTIVHKLEPIPKVYGTERN